MNVFSGSFLAMLLQDPLILILLLATTCILLVLRRMQENTGLPPGPFSWPVIGNLHLLGSKPHERLAELAKTFGDVYRLQLGSRRAIVLNSLDSVKEALGKKSSNFSSRPPLSSLQASDMDGRSIAFGPYNSKYLKNRRLAFLGLHSFMLDHEQLSSLTNDCTKRLCERFAGHNEHFDPAFDVQQSIAELNLTTMFGGGITETEKKELFLLSKSSGEFIKNNSINNLVDFLPWLRLFTKDFRGLLKGLVQNLVDFVKGIISRFPR